MLLNIININILIYEIALFVATETGTNGYSAPKKGIEELLKRFGFPYFDLILIHWHQSDNIRKCRSLLEIIKKENVRL